MREAQERVEEVALEMVDARIALARDARDEATRLRAAEGLTAAAGVGVAHTTVNVLVVDMDEALSQLERLQLQRGESVDVASREVEG